jgi:hypothetical protein
MLGRDVNAAHVIADMFLDMISSCKLPRWIDDDETMTKNSFIGATINPIVTG